MPGSNPEACESRRYSMFGIHVQSDIRLPIAPVAPQPGILPEWNFRRAATGQVPPIPDGPIVLEVACHAPCHDGRIAVRGYRGPGGLWLWNDLNGTYHIVPDARRVDTYPAPGVDEKNLALMLVGQVSALLLNQLGYPCLHSSAVATEYGAVVFLGPKGQGKSTMVSCFLQRGGVLLTDDILPLQVEQGEVVGIPSLPLMKVWPETAEHALRISGVLPNLDESVDKKLLLLQGRFPFAERPSRLSAIYLLDRYDPGSAGRGDIVTRDLSAREGVAALLAQTPHRSFLRPNEIATFLSIYARLVAQAPVRRLSFPNGFAYHESIHQQIMAEVAGR
jgi:hypothetical protein